MVYLFLRKRQKINSRSTMSRNHEREFWKNSPNGHFVKDLKPNTLIEEYCLVYFSFELSHFKISSTDSKVRTISMTQNFSLLAKIFQLIPDDRFKYSC